MAESTGAPALEREIAQIEQQLAEKREALNRETLHEVVREKIATTPAAPQPVPQPTPAPVPSTDSSAVPEELHQKVQALVNVAFTDSIEKAIKEAKASHNAALIDAFHDLLVDELYVHLVERGKLKKVA